MCVCHPVWDEHSETPTFAIAGMCLVFGPRALEVAVDVTLGADIAHQLTLQRLAIVEE